MTTSHAVPARLSKVLKVFVAVFALLMIYALTPAPAHAAGLTQIQVQAVVSLLKAFDVDSKTIGTVEAVLHGTNTSIDDDADTDDDADEDSTSNTNSGKKELVRPALSGASVCRLLAHSLKRGSSGEDVESLQAHLLDSGDLVTDKPTGYFGELTEKALKQWQARMGVVSSGDADSTGFGTVGPKTRDALLARCRGLQKEKPMHASSTPTTKSNDDDRPVCVLRASKESVALGESVTLTWESKHATHTGTASGEKGATSGSLTVTPTESTIYLKKVYGTGGESSCSTTVEVGDIAPATTVQIVLVSPLTQVASVASSIGAGLEVVLDAYLSLFGM